MVAPFSNRGPFLVAPAVQAYPMSLPTELLFDEVLSEEMLDSGFGADLAFLLTTSFLVAFLTGLVTFIFSFASLFFVFLSFTTLLTFICLDGTNSSSAASRSCGAVVASFCSNGSVFTSLHVGANSAGSAGFEEEE